MSNPTLSRPIPGDLEIFNIHAYSDASTSGGLGIVIGERWRAWAVAAPTEGQLDIGVLEALVFEFLVRTIILCGCSHANLWIHIDNLEVVDAWCNGRSRSSAANTVFKRIHEALRPLE